MKLYLEKIFELEDSGFFVEALKEYNNVYKERNKDYMVWKHFYFFLWISLEDAPENFVKKNNIKHRMQTLLKEGEAFFSDVADFNFIAGYTLSLFPYEFGDYQIMEKKADFFLLKATKLDPFNPIYKMFLWGSKTDTDRKELKQARMNAYPQMMRCFNGKGFLNRYFLSYILRCC